jgi:hypothetical protein
MIRIQAAGGLGNQLFIWVGAHYLSEVFSEEVCLVFINDRHSRQDRPNELHILTDFCSHPIRIESQRTPGLAIRFIDKLKLEEYKWSCSVLRKFGFYTFQNSDISFSSGKPRFVRAYFQNSDLVESCWDAIFPEIENAMRRVDIAKYATTALAQSIHFRRGDIVNLRNTHGVLSVKYFTDNSSSTLEKIVCTDDPEYLQQIQHALHPASILAPSEISTWQTLKIFCRSEEFLGSNSTLSWWAAKIRDKNGMNPGVLPSPWTKVDQGYERDLNVDTIGARIAPSNFEK